jgi:hypothetical protein
MVKIKDDVHSVLRISSAHNKWGPPDINIAQILHLSNFFELKRRVIYKYSFTSMANQKSVRYSVSISYFTNIAVQNVNKVHTCAHEWTSSLSVRIKVSVKIRIGLIVGMTVKKH